MRFENSSALECSQVFISMLILSYPHCPSLYGWSTWMWDWQMLGTLAGSGNWVHKSFYWEVIGLLEIPPVRVVHRAVCASVTFARRVRYIFPAVLCANIQS